VIHEAAILVPPPPATPLGAMATAALLAGRGCSVVLLEPASGPDGVAEPFLLPLPRPGRSSGADGLLSLLTTAARLTQLEDLLEQPAVPCQLLLPRHRLDLAADPAAFAAEVAREWPEAAADVAALERRLADLEAAVAAAPPRLLVGSPTRLGQAGDLLAFARCPWAWLKARSALGSPVPNLPDPVAAAGVAAIAVGLGGLGHSSGRHGDLWRPWAAARRGGRPRAGMLGVVGQLRARALAAGAVALTYDPDVLQVTDGGRTLGLRLGKEAPSIDTQMLVSGWPAAGLAPRTGGRAGARLARLAALAAPVRWAAQLVIEVPARLLPVGLGPRALLAGDSGPIREAQRPPDPLLLEVSTAAAGNATLLLTALVDAPAAGPDLAAHLRRRLEWLVPFLPADTPARLTPPDPRFPVRFAPASRRPVALPPLPERRLALVGPDVAPALGPEGEVLAALSVVGALSPSRA
jgi:hypothetical protein